MGHFLGVDSFRQYVLEPAEKEKISRIHSALKPDTLSRDSLILKLHRIYTMKEHTIDTLSDLPVYKVAEWVHKHKHNLAKFSSRADVIKNMSENLHLTINEVMGVFYNFHLDLPDHLYTPRQYNKRKTLQEAPKPEPKHTETIDLSKTLLNLPPDTKEVTLKGLGFEIVLKVS